MTISIRKIKEAPSAELIARTEKVLGCALPAGYLAFLAKYNGGEPETNVFQIPGVGNESGVNEFIDLVSLPKEIEFGGFEETKGVIPIAFAEGGNYICLAISEPDLGTVFFWDHEVANGRNGLVKLASSVQEFVGLLKPFDPTQIKLKPGQVKSAWIDPSLLEDLE